jgi:N-methylhydantoinase B
VAFKCLTSPLLLPINDGSFRPLNIVLPPGRVVSAEKPAAMRWWMTIPMTVVDTMFRALAPAIPEQVIAGHHADLAFLTTYGVDERTGRFFFGLTGSPGGGWGATHRGDGMNAVICINDGDTHNTPVESTEAKSPLIIDEYALRTDSGGAGRFRGGLGSRQRVRVRSRAVLNSFVDRTKCAPWGVLGGRDALPNAVRIERATGHTETFRNGKLDSIPLAPGDAYVVEVGGGGGFGDPLEREPERVHEDVLRGYVSEEAARTAYGVIFSHDRTGALRVHLEDTAALRAELRSLRDGGPGRR